MQARGHRHAGVAVPSRRARGSPAPLRPRPILPMVVVVVVMMMMVAVVCGVSHARAAVGRLMRGSCGASWRAWGGRWRRGTTTRETTLGRAYSAWISTATARCLLLLLLLLLLATVAFPGGEQEEQE